jgi:outer membrane protein TolC
MKFYKFLTILLICTSSIIFSQNKLTLQKTIEIVLGNNLNIKIAKNLNKIANNNINIGNANLLPRIDLSTSTTYNDNKLVTPMSTGYSSNSVNLVGLHASYTLFDGFNNYSQLNKLKLSGKISDYETRSTIEQVVLQTTVLYYQIANLEDKLQTSREALQISRERVERQKNKLDLGQCTNIDYLSAVVDFDRDSLNYINLNTTLANAKQNLNLLLNRNVDYDFTLDKLVQFDTIPPLDELIKLAFQRNAEYLSALEKINLAKEELKISRSPFLPSLLLEGGYSFTKTNNEFDTGFNDPSRISYAALTLKYNLFNGFRNEIQFQNSKILLDNSEIAERNVKLALITNLTNLFKLYTDTRTALNLEEKALETAQLNFARTKNRFELGEVTLTQFRQAQLNLINTKNSISELKYSTKQYEYQIRKETGTLIVEK